MSSLKALIAGAADSGAVGTVMLEGAAVGTIPADCAVVHGTDGKVHNDFMNKSAGSSQYSSGMSASDTYCQVHMMLDGKRSIMIMQERVAVWEDGVKIGDEYLGSDNWQFPTMQNIDENRILVSYYGTDTDYCVCVVITITDGVPSLGTVLNVFTTTATCYPEVTVLTPTSAIYVHKDPGTPYHGWAYAIAISGTTCTKGTGVEFADAHYLQDRFRLDRISDNSCVCCYRDNTLSNFVRLEVLTINGTSIDMGNQLDVGTNPANSFHYKTLSATRGILTYYQSGGAGIGRAKLIHIASDVISFGNTADYCPIGMGSGTGYMGLARMADDMCIVLYSTDSDGTRYRTMTHDGTDITLGPDNQLTTELNNTFTDIAATDWRRAVYILQGDSGDISFIDFAAKPAGFLVDAVTNGQDVTIRTLGIKDGFTGLTTGADYYIDSRDGTTLNTTGFTLAGTAISPTQMLLADSNFSLNNLAKPYTDVLPSHYITDIKEFPPYIVGGSSSGLCLYVSGTKYVSNTSSFWLNLGYVESIVLSTPTDAAWNTVGEIKGGAGIITNLVGGVPNGASKAHGFRLTIDGVMYETYIPSSSMNNSMRLAWGYFGKEYGTSWNGPYQNIMRLAGSEVQVYSPMYMLNQKLPGLYFANSFKFEVYCEEYYADQYTEKSAIMYYML